MGGVLLTLGLLATTAVGPAGGDCMRLERSVPAGVILTDKDLSPAPCNATRPTPATRYVPSERAVRALRDLQRGEVVERVPGFALPGVRPGQILYLKAAVGSVWISREVVAIQAARPGRPLFVRAADGAVFAVPYPEDAQ